MSQFLFSQPVEFIDLFSGCGGFSTGLEMAGHKCLLGVDFNADAIESFKLNHHESKTFLGDIKTLKADHLYEMIGKKSIDMVVGGPPCQGFSTVGRGQAEDSRNKLFKEFVRIVKILNPKVIIFENVTGIVAAKNKKILNAIFNEFEKLGFNMSAQVLSSKDFGVASNRRRAIIMGVKGAVAQFPKSFSKNEMTTVSDVFSNLKSLDGQIYNHDIKAAAIKKADDLARLKCLPQGCGIRYQADQEKYLPKKLWYNVDFKKLREGRFRQTKLQRLSMNQASPTILTSRTSYYHPIENRFLTAREAAACQSFPNDFIFSGSTTSIFRQIGNAVPPLMAMEIGLALMEIKKSKNKIKNTIQLDSKAFCYTIDHTQAQAS